MTGGVLTKTSSESGAYCQVDLDTLPVTVYLAARALPAPAPAGRRAVQAIRSYWLGSRRRLACIPPSLSPLSLYYIDLTNVKS